MAAPKKGGLGRGLDALFADAVPAYIEEPEKTEEKTRTAFSTTGSDRISIIMILTDIPIIFTAIWQIEQDFLLLLISFHTRNALCCFCLWREKAWKYRRLNLTRCFLRYSTRA